jgi:hypothetical protein
MQSVESEDIAMTEGDATTSGDPTATNSRLFSSEVLTTILVVWDVMKYVSTRDASILASIYNQR